MASNEQIKFRLFQMPCCGQLLCWVNPRLPNHCPECGKQVLLQLKSGEYTRMIDENAWLRFSSEGAILNKRQKEIIAVYRSGFTLRESARKLGISTQRVHQVIRLYAPELMRPRFVHKRKRPHVLP